jgi:hypothetical protein
MPAYRDAARGQRQSCLIPSNSAGAFYLRRASSFSSRRKAMPFEPYSPEPQVVSPELALAREVRDLLAVPERWCQGRLSDGRDAYCLDGAIIVAGDYSPVERFVVRERLNKFTGGGSFVAWNDDRHTTHADIVRVMNAVVASFE